MIDVLIAKQQSLERCPRFHAQGFCVASGGVDAGCKRAVGDRLKRAGMR